MEKIKVALFGVKGLWGSDLLKNAPSFVEATGFTHADVDITDANQVSRTLDEVKPDWVINAAAYNQVDKAEEDRETAYAVNVTGPKNLAEASEKVGAAFIHGSTDYVFPGKEDGLYTETDTPQPLGYYGQTKWEGEKAAQACSRSYVLRVNTLYGLARTNHALKTVEAVQQNKPVKIVHDLHGSPTYTGDLARWTYQLIEKKPDPGVYHLCHKGVCTRLAFSEKICELMGRPKPYPFEILSLNQLSLKAKRPLRPALSTDKWEAHIGPLENWEDGLKNYLNELKIYSVTP